MIALDYQFRVYVPFSINLYFARVETNNPFPGHERTEKTLHTAQQLWTVMDHLYPSLYFFRYKIISPRPLLRLNNLFAPFNAILILEDLLLVYIFLLFYLNKCSKKSHSLGISVAKYLHLLSRSLWRSLTLCCVYKTVSYKTVYQCI